ncbi:mitochondrial-processing peptidase subunit alpha [Brevipalpus obovatus]|uniref:mitochondrial-processing peptidase subunit alpha n=1 Tax=Brevipalpus obovatus TaxID=246614 RepID=UPI003D9EB606
MIVNKLLRGQSSASGIGFLRKIIQPVRQRSSGIEIPQPADVSSTVQKVKLSEPLPGFPRIIYPQPGPENDETKVTTLKNGLKVASQAKFGQFCTVGVVFDSGSRYEVNFPSGVSHFLEKLAFQSTASYSSREHIWQDLEKHGGIVDCQGSRDCMIYAASVDVQGLEAAIKIISETTMRPNFLEEEISIAKQTLNFELQDIFMRAEQEMTLLELIHQAAYRSNTLGLPRLCPADNVDKMSRELAMKFLKVHHTPERTVLAGVGCEHQRLVELAEKYFVETKPVWELDESIVNLTMKPDKSMAQYTGGLATMDKDLSDVSQGVAPIPELTHIVLGFESSSHQYLEDFVPTCVLNMMMGGGGSFSAGGPGKGMYTRLYLDVLNRYHWMYNATAYNHAYVDSGVFCIHASGPPRKLKDLIYVIAHEAASMGLKLRENELERAKSQLQSMLLMNLEARPVVFEDIARQVVANGFRRSPRFYMDAIDKVTWEDVKRVVDRMMKTNVSLAVLGDLKNLPPIEEIQSFINRSTTASTSKKFSIFS